MSESVTPVARPPAPLRWLLAGAAVSIVLLIALPVAMYVDRDATVESIVRDRPGLSREQLDFAFAAVIVYTVVLHTIDIVLLVWFTAKAWSGRRWARIALSIYLVLASALSLISATEGMQYLVVVIPTDVVHLVMLALLWVPESTRRFFDGSPVHDPDTPHPPRRSSHHVDP